MQRLLSLITLGVLGGLGYLFLQGGGLDQLTMSQSGEQEQQQQDGYDSPGPWQASTQQPAANPTTDGGNTQTSTNYGSRETIRIASFNIQIFGNKKASKPYVMKDLADIINQFDVVAIQEIRSKNQSLIPNFVQLVNQESGRRFDYVIGRRLGISNSKEQYVFLFDTQKIEIDRHSIYTVSDPDGLLHREPLVATFRTRVHPDRAFTFTLVNMHTDYDIAGKEMDILADVYTVVRRSGRGEDDIIMLGDFNVDDRHLGRLGELPGIRPLIEGVWTNTRQTKQYDNLIVHQPSTTEYTGRSGVFDFMRFKNRTQKQALQISDHFPVWAEFSIYELDNSGRIASRSARRRVSR